MMGQAAEMVMLRKGAVVTTPDRDSLRRMIEEALPTVRERAELLDEISSALEHGEDLEALTLMRRYCGLPPT